VETARRQSSLSRKNGQPDHSLLVDWNSGIPNRAFVLAAEVIGGDPWDVPGRIWYSTLRQLSAKSRFVDCARLTVTEALEGFERKTAVAVAQAWKEVEIDVPVP
jgi:Zn-dependent metalloprotease